MFCSRRDGLKRKLTATLLLLFVFEICRRGRKEATWSRISTGESFEVEFVAAELSLPERCEIVMQEEEARKKAETPPPPPPPAGLL